MGGGLLQLVAYGVQDIIITGNPQITFFKIVYRRHNNFAMESIEQTFEGKVGFGKKLSCTISRNGDLLNNIYLEIDLNLIRKIRSSNPIQDSTESNESNESTISTEIEWAKISNSNTLDLVYFISEPEADNERFYEVMDAMNDGVSYYVNLVNPFDRSVNKYNIFKKFLFYYRQGYRTFLTQCYSSILSVLNEAFNNIENYDPSVNLEEILFLDTSSTAINLIKADGSISDRNIYINRMVSNDSLSLKILSNKFNSEISNYDQVISVYVNDAYGKPFHNTYKTLSTDIGMQYTSFTENQLIEATEYINNSSNKIYVLVVLFTEKLDIFLNNLNTGKQIKLIFTETVNFSQRIIDTPHQLDIFNEYNGEFYQFVGSNPSSTYIHKFLPKKINGSTRTYLTIDCLNIIYNCVNYKAQIDTIHQKLLNITDYYYGLSGNCRINRENYDRDITTYTSCMISIKTKNDDTYLNDPFPYIISSQFHEGNQYIKIGDNKGIFVNPNRIYFFSNFFVKEIAINNNLITEDQTIGDIYGLGDIVYIVIDEEIENEEQNTTLSPLLDINYREGSAKSTTGVESLEDSNNEVSNLVTISENVTDSTFSRLTTLAEMNLPSEVPVSVNGDASVILMNGATEYLNEKKVAKTVAAAALTTAIAELVTATAELTTAEGAQDPDILYYQLAEDDARETVEKAEKTLQEAVAAVANANDWVEQITANDTTASGTNVTEDKSSSPLFLARAAPSASAELDLYVHGKLDTRFTEILAQSISKLLKHPERKYPDIESLIGIIQRQKYNVSDYDLCFSLLLTYLNAHKLLFQDTDSGRNNKNLSLKNLNKSIILLTRFITDLESEPKPWTKLGRIPGILLGFDTDLISSLSPEAAKILFLDQKTNKKEGLKMWKEYTRLRGTTLNYLSYDDVAVQLQVNLKLMRDTANDTLKTIDQTNINDFRFTDLFTIKKLKKYFSLTVINNAFKEVNKILSNQEETNSTVYKTWKSNVDGPEIIHNEQQQYYHGNGVSTVTKLSNTVNIMRLILKYNVRLDPSVELQKTARATFIQRIENESQSSKYKKLEIRYIQPTSGVGGIQYKFEHQIDIDTSNENNKSFIDVIVEDEDDNVIYTNTTDSSYPVIRGCNNEDAPNYKWMMDDHGNFIYNPDINFHKAEDEIINTTLSTTTRVDNKNLLTIDLKINGYSKDYTIYLIKQMVNNNTILEEEISVGDPVWVQYFKEELHYDSYPKDLPRRIDYSRNNYTEPEINPDSSIQKVWNDLRRNVNQEEIIRSLKDTANNLPDFPVSRLTATINSNIINNINEVCVTLKGIESGEYVVVIESNNIPSFLVKDDQDTVKNSLSPPDVQWHNKEVVSVSRQCSISTSWQESFKMNLSLYGNTQNVNKWGHPYGCISFDLLNQHPSYDYYYQINKKITHDNGDINLLFDLDKKETENQRSGKIVKINNKHESVKITNLFAGLYTINIYTNANGTNLVAKSQKAIYQPFMIKNQGKLKNSIELLKQKYYVLTVNVYGGLSSQDNELTYLWTFPRNLKIPNYKNTVRSRKKLPRISRSQIILTDEEINNYLKYVQCIITDGEENQLLINNNGCELLE